jgi:hypothetical protein
MTEARTYVSLTPEAKRLDDEEGSRTVHPLVMAVSPEVVPGEFTQDTYEDTIELAMTPEQALALRRAAERRLAGTNVVEATPATPSLQNENARLDRRLLLLGASVVAIVVGTALTAIASRAPTVNGARPISVAPSPTVSVDSREQPVRLTNPFDSSEVFELPPETTPAEARQSVAELLLERARERREAEGVKRAAAATPIEHPRIAQNSASHRG